MLKPLPDKPCHGCPVEEGRRIFDNLTKFFVWTLPTNGGEALVIMASVVAGTGLSLPVLPGHLEPQAVRWYEGLVAEIQVRTILQHAWVEIEHDIQYKSARAIPHAIRRRLAAVAGLLEIADREFQAIRDEYERSRRPCGD